MVDITIQEFQERSNTIVSLLDLMKKTDISIKDKQELYNIIMKIPKKTDNQKDRFVRFWGIKPTEFKKETLISIGKSYGCGASAVRGAIMSVRSALYRIPNDDFIVLRDIYQKYKK